jgi:hypothetical protein
MQTCHHTAWKYYNPDQPLFQDSIYTLTDGIMKEHPTAADAGKLQHHRELHSINNGMRHTAECHEEQIFQSTVCWSQEPPFKSPVSKYPLSLQHKLDVARKPLWLLSLLLCQPQAPHTTRLTSVQMVTEKDSTRNLTWPRRRPGLPPLFIPQTWRKFPPGWLGVY